MAIRNVHTTICHRQGLPLHFAVDVRDKTLQASFSLKCKCTGDTCSLVYLLLIKSSSVIQGGGFLVNNKSKISVSLIIVIIIIIIIITVIIIMIIIIIITVIIIIIIHACSLLGLLKF